MPMQIPSCFRQLFRQAGSKASPPPPGTCIYPDCGKQVYPGSDFCSLTHRDRMPPNGDSLVELPPTSKTYQNVLLQFGNTWRHHDKQVPAVQCIYRVYLSEDIRDSYHQYQTHVAEERGLTDGHECRRFHGTKRACALGDNGHKKLCDRQDCSLCGIIRTSFKIEFSGANKPWKGLSTGRFGRGIYTSATSSKADDYSWNVPPNTSPYNKTMLLTKVLLPYKSDCTSKYF